MLRNQFSDRGQIGSATTDCFKQTMVLYMPRARQQSVYSTVFSCFRFQYNQLRYGPTLTVARFSFLPPLRENVFHKTRRGH